MSSKNAHSCIKTTPGSFSKHISLLLFNGDTMLKLANVGKKNSTSKPQYASTTPGRLIHRHRYPRPFFSSLAVSGSPAPPRPPHLHPHPRPHERMPHGHPRLLHPRPRRLPCCCVASSQRMSGVDRGWGSGCGWGFCCGWASGCSCDGGDERSGQGCGFGCGCDSDSCWANGSGCGDDHADAIRVCGCGVCDRGVHGHPHHPLSRPRHWSNGCETCSDQIPIS